MGSVVSVGSMGMGSMEAVENTLPFLTHEEATSLSEAVLAPKPPPKPVIPKAEPSTRGINPKVCIWLHQEMSCRVF